MNSIILMTALTATSGLFGGHKSSCGGGSSRCGGRQVMTRHHAYAAPASSCYAGSSCYSAPMAYAPAPMAAPAPQAMPTPPVAPKTSAIMAPTPYYVQSYYYAPTSPCANGQCYRR